MLSCGTGSCFTGGVVAWNANAAESLAPISGAVVSAKVGLTTRTATTDANGNFELTDLPFFGPMVLTITKAGYVPWSWRFTGRPSEKEYGMIPVTTTNETVPSAGGQTNEVTLSGAKLLLPPECFTVAGVPFSGAIVVETAPWTFYPRHPFPPDPKFLSNIVLMPANIDSGVWVSVRGGAGEVLTPVVGANAPKLRYITDSHVKPIVLRRDDSKGYFVVEPLPVTTPQVPLYFHDTALTETTAMWASAKSSVTNVMEISADRSLNYPFDVLVGRSAFPVTVQGPGIMDLGRLDITNLGVELPTFFVLDQRQSPGVHYANLDAPQPRATFRKPRIINFSISPQGAGVTAVRLGLGRTLPELIPSNAASGYGAMPPPPATPPWRVSSLETDNAFLAPNEAFSRIDSPWDAHIADTYFTAINAPATLAAWKTRNDFPASLTAVPSTGTFVTAFYYNLGDLGFSRRLSMRKTIAFDGEPNISMAVTNFRTIDEARCDLGPIATVCMEYARRSNGDPQRFVKFTAYDEGGYLLKDISLDGGATKPMPNLCITCHGGRPFDPLTRNGNLGASFLPFDLDSFGYHRKIGTQKPVFAQLNQGVLDTHPAPAIIELIQGWYGNASPLAAPATFNAGFVPPAWQAPAEAPTKYIDVFRNSCRICHISRPESVQFDSYARFNAITAPRAVPGGFSSPVCLIGGGMPATQRSWAIFWGSRAGRKVQVNSLQAPTIPDQPALMLNQPALGDLSNFLRVR